MHRFIHVWASLALVAILFTSGQATGQELVRLSPEKAQLLGQIETALNLLLNVRKVNQSFQQLSELSEKNLAEPLVFVALAKVFWVKRDIQSVGWNMEKAFQFGLERLDYSPRWAKEFLADYRQHIGKVTFVASRDWHEADISFVLFLTSDLLERPSVRSRFFQQIQKKGKQLEPKRTVCPRRIHDSGVEITRVVGTPFFLPVGHYEFTLDPDKCLAKRVRVSVVSDAGQEIELASLGNEFAAEDEIIETSVDRETEAEEALVTPKPVEPAPAIEEGVLSEKGKLLKQIESARYLLNSKNSTGALKRLNALSNQESGKNEPLIYLALAEVFWFRDEYGLVKRNMDKALRMGVENSVADLHWAREFFNTYLEQIDFINEKVEEEEGDGLWDGNGILFYSQLGWSGTFGGKSFHSIDPVVNRSGVTLTLGIEGVVSEISLGAGVELSLDRVMAFYLTDTLLTAGEVDWPFNVGFRLNLGYMFWCGTLVSLFTRPRITADIVVRFQTEDIQSRLELASIIKPLGNLWNQDLGLWGDWLIFVQFGWHLMSNETFSTGSVVEQKGQEYHFVEPRREGPRGYSFGPVFSAGLRWQLVL